MLRGRRVSPLAIDLTRMHRRTVTSFYSNLVTRPTGRAVRLGVESQIAEIEVEQHLCLSVLDFTQVRVLDYSCADEIVAKLLLRFHADDRPAEAFFLARGLQDHHREAIEAVLERHSLLLVVEERPGVFSLLGPTDALQRRCWSALVSVGRGNVEALAVALELTPEVVAHTVQGLCSRRVALPLGGETVCSLPYLLNAPTSA